MLHLYVDSLCDLKPLRHQGYIFGEFLFPLLIFLGEAFEVLLEVHDADGVGVEIVVPGGDSECDSKKEADYFADPNHVYNELKLLTIIHLPRTSTDQAIFIIHSTNSLVRTQ